MRKGNVEMTTLARLTTMTTLAILLSAALLFCIPLLPRQGAAQVPEREEQLVYGLRLWSGETYSTTFAPQEAEKMYMIAGVGNIISPRRTEIYFWPITREYRANWSALNELVEGRLEILKNGENVATLDMVDYVYRYPEGRYGASVEIHTGQKARDLHERFQQEVEAFKEDVVRYQDEQREYREQVRRLQEEEGAEEELPDPPAEPRPPREQVSDVLRGFYIELDEGLYTLRMLDGEGGVIPDSERELRVFSHRRKGVRYEVIPEERWTYPEESSESGDIIYLKDERTFYLKPYLSAEYPERDFAMLNSLNKPDTEQLSSSRWRWTSMELLDGGLVQLLRDGEIAAEVDHRPYSVQQLPGSALGYRIVEWDPERHKNRPPHFRGYRLSFEADGRYSIRLVEEGGGEVPGSHREVRPVNAENMNLLFILTAVPLLFGLVVYIWRRR